jgi:Arc/MetJ family transcription regulator
MKTTVDIPEKELADAMRFAGADTKREAIVTAIREYNHRRRLGALVKHAGTCDTMDTVEKLREQRRRR